MLDVGCGFGGNSVSFLSQQWCEKVVGIDLMPSDIESDRYEHIQNAYETTDLDEQFDMVWSSHVLEHVPNVQHFLGRLHDWTKDDGWLAISVPPSRQDRFHIGHSSLWTPAHLVYNLICAGWDCKDAIWYTDYMTIGLMVKRKPTIDLSWRTSLPSELRALNHFTPITINHEDGAWWGNNWPEEFNDPRIEDPPMVVIGDTITNLPPQIQLACGPNPELRKKYERA